MSKVILITVYLIIGLTVFSQKRYKCQYTDTTSFNMSDTVINGLKNSINLSEDSAINEEIGRQMVMQLLKKPLFMIQLRSVRASNEVTVIIFDRYTKEGRLNMETFDSLLYKDDEIFPDSASGFNTIPIQLPRKKFISTGSFFTIMKYKCTEYLSTDSTARIWVTTELPGYINPGIRKGNIQGAVLGFELKSEVTITKSFLTRIEEDYK